ncbi:MAG: histidine phosphatase family protein [Candidatus Saccharimonadaceae bacterium]
MAMPNNMIFVRHGQSEANVVHKSDKDGEAHASLGAVNNRPDWRQRLSPAGIDQARIAGEWIKNNFGGLDLFEALYVSPFLRTRETAGYMSTGSNATWLVDDKIVERSWGIYGIVPKAEQRKKFPLTSKLRSASPWYVRLDGGESMPDVYSRFRDFQGAMHRDHDGQNVLAVSHGDFMNVVRYGVERMLPEEWEEMDADEASTIRNCTILWYTRVNPENPNDVRGRMHWRKMIYPDAVHESPDGGQWVELGERRRYNSEDLIAQAQQSEPLLND